MAFTAIQPNCNARPVLHPRYTTVTTKQLAQGQAVSGAKQPIQQEEIVTRQAIHVQHAHHPICGCVQTKHPVHMPAALGQTTTATLRKHVLRQPCGIARTPVRAQL